MPPPTIHSLMIHAFTRISMLCSLLSQMQSNTMASYVSMPRSVRYTCVIHQSTLAMAD